MKLTIEAFRGAYHPVVFNFKKTHDLTIIYGENGSGKTTVSDALEFLFHGNAGSLDEKSLDGKGKIPALVHAKRKATDLRVAWEEGTELREAKLHKSKPHVTGELSATKLRTLRRNLITSLIEETPAKRFQRIQHFVSLPSVEREEEQLKIFIKENRDYLIGQQNRAEQSRNELTELHKQAQTATPSIPTLEEWVKGVISQHDETQKENKTMLTDLIQEIYRLREGFAAMKKAIEASGGSKAALASEDDNLKKVAAESTTQIAGALGVLEAAKRFLSKESTQTCPVCDTPQTHEDLQLKVASKLDALKVLSDQNRKTEVARKAVDTAGTVLETQQDSFFENIVKLCQIHQAIVDSDQWSVPDLIGPIVEPSSARDLTPEWFACLEKEAASIRPLREWLEREVESIERNRVLKSRLGPLIVASKDAKKEYQALTKLISKAEAIREVLRGERTRYANDTLAAISGDFARLYESIHRGEDIEKIRLYLHADRQGSAMLDGELHGRESASPVAYLSESHLDTLGLCLFLALEKQSTPSDTVLFLDDAIGSVDEAHMGRLYEMIVMEAQHFKHVIITSHYQPLRFKFKWGQLTKQNVDLLELGRWTLDGGISWQRGCDSEIKLLKRLLDEKDNPTGIAASSGKVLEYLLDFLTGIYRCKLPRNPGSEQRWTLGDYKMGLESNKRKLLNALECEHLDDDRTVVKAIALAPLLEKVFTQLEIRNALGAHFKALAGQFDEIAEAQALGSATMELVEALCDEDHQLPESSKNGSCWTNKGTKQTRQLHPLIQPL